MPRGWVAVCVGLCAFASRTVLGAPEAAAEPIELELRPRICTLSANDEQCNTVVQAQWRSPRNESVCLAIVGHPEIKQCWENHSEGRYTVALVFREDLLVELRDLQMQTVLASQAIKVIREALQLRRKRRPPWSILP